MVGGGVGKPPSFPPLLESEAISLGNIFDGETKDAELRARGGVEGGLGGPGGVEGGGGGMVRGRFAGFVAGGTDMRSFVGGICPVRRKVMTVTRATAFPLAVRFCRRWHL